MTDADPARPFNAETQQMALLLTRLLVTETSLNEYLEKLLPEVADLFQTGRILLVDYRERTEQFELLHFEGYPSDSVYKLRRRFDAMDLARALTIREPYNSRVCPEILCVPLYFRDVLEAILVLEADIVLQVTEPQQELLSLVTRFLALLMSSTRLRVNREQLVDLNDLQRARQIQISFLPQKAPKSNAWEIHGHNSSSSLVGGDYYDFFRSDERSVQCILADACGHGLAAALIMSNFRGLLQTEIRRRQNYDDLFDSLNRSVHFDEDLIQYLTGVFLDLDEEARSLRYFNAGHFDPLIVDRRGHCRTLPGGGPPLGMFKESSYRYHEARVESGDLIALFTDGLVDLENSNGDYFGVERLTEVLRAHRQAPLPSAAREVLSTASDFTGGRRSEDDVTLFLMRIL